MLHRHIPKYIIDKRIPYTSEIANLTAIEKPATEGVRELLKLLLAKMIVDN